MNLNALTKEARADPVANVTVDKAPDEMGGHNYLRRPNARMPEAAEDLKESLPQVSWQEWPGRSCEDATWKTDAMLREKQVLHDKEGS